MQKSFFKNIIAIVLVIVVLVPTISNLHALDHLSDDDTTPCEQCDFLNNYNHLDYTINDFSYSEKNLIYYPSSEGISLEYDSPIEKIVKPTFVFNKPPPVL